MPVRLVVEADDDVAHLHQALRDGFVLTDLLWFVVRRAVDVDGGIVLAVEEVWLRGSTTRSDTAPSLGGRSIRSSTRSSQRFSSWLSQRLRSAAIRSARDPAPPAGRHSAPRQLGKQVADQKAVEVLVVRLVAVVEQAFIARLAAGLRAAVFQRVRVEVADLQRAPGEQRQHGRVLGDLPQHAGAAFGRFVEEDFLPILRRRHRLARRAPAARAGSASGWPA